MQFSLQILPYFFYNSFIFSYWPLIFDIIKYISLYRLILKFFNSVTNYSLPFLISLITRFVLLLKIITSHPLFSNYFYQTEYLNFVFHIDTIIHIIAL